MDPVETPGTTLSQARQAQGVSIEELAAITRIAPRQIRSLEDDRYDDLPGEVYVRGFLRNCSRELGLDDAEIIARFERLTGSRPAQAELPNELEAADASVGSLFDARPSFRTSYVIAILAIILGLSLSLLIFGAAEQERFSDSDRGSDVTYPHDSPSNPN